jgi:nicotinic acetylcholine receptor
VDKLKADLLDGYDRLTRPENYATVTECWVGLTVIQMELDETRGVLETHAWMRLNWSDSKLKWDPKDYEEIKQLNVQADEVS